MTTKITTMTTAEALKQRPAPGPLVVQAELCPLFSMETVTGAKQRGHEASEPEKWTRGPGARACGHLQLPGETVRPGCAGLSGTGSTPGRRLVGSLLVLSGRRLLPTREAWEPRRQHALGTEGESSHGVGPSSLPLLLL